MTAGPSLVEQAKPWGFEDSIVSFSGVCCISPVMGASGLAETPRDHGFEVPVAGGVDDALEYTNGDLVVDGQQ